MASNTDGDDTAVSRFMIAAREGFSGELEHLIGGGADVNQVDVNGNTALINAVLNGYEKCVTVLTDAGADVNMVDKTGRSALNFAIHSNQWRCVYHLVMAGADLNGTVAEAMMAESHLCLRPLVAAGADVNQAHVNGFTPLTYVAGRNDLDGLKLLLGLGADVYQTDDTGQTPLMKAAEKGDVACLEAILISKLELSNDDDEVVAGLCSQGPTRLLDFQNHWNKTALMYAAENGHDACVAALIKAGAGVNIGSDITALMLAAKEGHNKCVKLLVEAHADVNYQHDNTSALVLAINGRYKNCANTLLKAGAHVEQQDLPDCPSTAAIPLSLRSLSSQDIDVNHTTDGMTVLMEAAQAGEEVSVRNLLIRGADVHRVNDEGKTALILAAHEGFHKCVELLIKAGADVNATCVNNCSALIYAAMEDHTDSIDLLVEAGANVNIKSRSGYTALLHLMENHDYETAAVLIKAGANVNIVAGNGMSPVTVAAFNNRLEWMRSLCDPTVDRDLHEQNLLTALSVAISRGNIETVKYVIMAGANVNLSYGGETPLMSAAKKNFVDIMRVLLDSGACVDIPEVTLLVWAFNNCTSEVCRVLIAAGADVNEKDRFGRAALLVASSKNDADGVVALIGAGASVNVHDPLRNTALHFVTDKCASVRDSSVNLRWQLRQRLAALQTAVHAQAAALRGQAPQVTGLVPAYVHNSLKWRVPDLDNGILEAKHKIIKALVDAGANVNAFTKMGESPIMQIVSNPQMLPSVRVLLNAGAQVNIQDLCSNTKKTTVLFDAVVSAHMSCVTVENVGQSALGLVIKAGVKINTKSECCDDTLRPNTPIESHDNALMAYMSDFEELNSVIATVLIAAGESSEGKPIRISPPVGEEAEEQEYFLQLSDNTLRNRARERIRKHLLDLDSNSNLYLRVPQLRLPWQLAKILLYNIEL